MTGVGVARGPSELGEVTVEVRAVNGRALAVKTRLPAAAVGLEAAIERAVREQLQRGTVSVVMELAVEGGRELDAVRARELVAQLRALAQQLGLRDDLAASHLLALAGAGGSGAPRTSWELPAQLRARLARALEALVADRAREGVAIAAVVASDLDQIDALLQDVAARAPAVVADYRARLLQRVNEFLAQRAPALTEADVIKEVALFADRAEASEELQRLREHSAAARSLLAASDPVGRRLEFTAQEMGREANTLGSKSPDAATARMVVEMKAAIERIKEQVANLE